MRDDFDSRLGRQSRRFSGDLGRALARSAPAWPARPVGRHATHQLLALVASFLITGLTFNATATA